MFLYDSLTARLWAKEDSDAVYQETMKLDQAASIKQLGNLIDKADRSITD